ncbi:MAG TPA: hypothetical protein VHM19_08950 [Polyangiales bacterium]|jgi:hypothetical protein|nr:hypothetical protein [Polyangiales bacterium]
MATNDSVFGRLSTTFTSTVVVLVFAATACMCTAWIDTSPQATASAQHAEQMPVAEPFAVVQHVRPLWLIKQQPKSAPGSVMPRNWQLSYRARALHRC